MATSLLTLVVPVVMLSLCLGYGHLSVDTRGAGGDVVVSVFRTWPPLS